MTKISVPTEQEIARMDDEQLPVARHRLHGIGHFFGLYGAEHVAATEFVFGATFVALGAGLWDVLIGLLIGNTLAMLSFMFITARIATDTRLSLYTYLDRLCGASTSRVYNGANVVIFAVISAAMVTVSATAVTAQLQLPPQVEPYPTNLWFVLTVVFVATVVVLVAMYGFDVLTEFASICAPWLAVMFTTGGMVLIPALSEAVTGYTQLGLSEFLQLSSSSVWTGTDAEGEPGIGMLEVAGFAWAANTFAHFGLIDMALFRYAKKWTYGIASSAGMMFGHYVAWISAGFMGAAVAALSKTSIVLLDPGQVAFYALAWSGFIVVIVAGWTTANSNLYRAGLAAQAVFPTVSRTRVTLFVGVGVVIASCFPYVYQSMLPLLTYSGLLLVPIGGVVFAEHYVFKWVGYTRYWSRFKGLAHNVPALATWALSLVFGFGLNFLDLMPYYYLFVPTWAFSIVCYTVMARFYGAAESYPEEQEAEDEFMRRVHAYQDKQAAEEGGREVPKDKSLTTRLITAVWVVFGIIVPCTLAFITLFFSPDLFRYYVNVERFYDVTIWCTITYFVFAYWDLQRAKAHHRAHGAVLEKATA